MPARVTHPVVHAQNTQVGARNEPETRAHGTLHTGSPVGQRGTAHQRGTQSLQAMRCCGRPSQLLIAWTARMQRPSRCKCAINPGSPLAHRCGCKQHYSSGRISHTPPSPPPTRPVKPSHTAFRITAVNEKKTATWRNVNGAWGRGATPHSGTL